MNKTKKYSIIMPINNSTRKSRTSNSDTFMALMNPAYKRDILERKEREQRELKKRSLRNLAVQLSKGDKKAKEEVSKLPENELETVNMLHGQIKRAERREKEKELYLLNKSKSKPIPIEAPTPVITTFEPPFEIDVSKGIKRSPSRRKLGGKRKHKKGKKSIKKK
tara:strand:- start:2389 stop:2883 length:495 start_codon:yes stop_codon:yes gene_type:complete